MCYLLNSRITGVCNLLNSGITGVTTSQMLKSQVCATSQVLRYRYVLAPKSWVTCMCNLLNGETVGLYYLLNSGITGVSYVLNSKIAGYLLPSKCCGYRCM